MENKQLISNDLAYKQLRIHYVEIGDEKEEIEAVVNSLVSYVPVCA